VSVLYLVPHLLWKNFSVLVAWLYISIFVSHAIAGQGEDQKYDETT
jgi:hypothetical protein